MFDRSRESQKVFSSSNKVTSGDFVSPNSSVKAAPTTSSRIWCRQAKQSICPPRSCYSSVQAPFWIPVLEEVVSNPQAMIFSVVCQLSRVCLIVSASVLPVKSSVFVMQRFLFSFSCTSTTASLFTFPNPPRSERSFPSKLICPGLQEN